MNEAALYQMLTDLSRRMDRSESSISEIRDTDVLPWPDAADGTSFSGIAYVRGVKTSGLNSTSAAWVKVDIAAGTAVEDAGPPPNPFPDGIEYFEKAATYGNIHVTRFG